MKKQDLIKLGISFGLEKRQIEKVMMKITLLSNSELFLIDEIDNKYIDKINKLFERFKKGEPFEYLLNNSEFYGFDFFVDNRVLIPRNDSEVIVSKSLEEIKKVKKDFLLIDVGTGSCCIPISIVKNNLGNTSLKNTFALDISIEALEVAKINVKKHNLENQIKICKSDLLSYFLDKSSNVFTESNIKEVIITANLPYIKNQDFENMDYSVINYEPKIALYGGEKTGFEMYEKLIKQCFEIKKLYKIEKLILFMEIGFDQYKYSESYLRELGLKFQYFKDNSGTFRLIKVIF